MIAETEGDYQVDEVREESNQVAEVNDLEARRAGGGSSCFARTGVASTVSRGVKTYDAVSLSAG